LFSLPLTFIIISYNILKVNRFFKIEIVYIEFCAICTNEKIDSKANQFKCNLEPGVVQLAQFREVDVESFCVKCRGKNYFSTLKR
jgi:hypothetical protein